VIESVMFFALGFLAASLIALVLLSAVWQRAVRLTTRRIEGAIPVSMAEIQADKDQLRAEFAMSTRRLENGVEQLKLKTSEQLAEIGRKSEAIRLLKEESDQKTARVTALENQERTLRDQLRSTEADLNQKSKALNEAEIELANKSGEIAQAARAIADKSVESDSRRVEIVALETQCVALKDRVADLEHEVTSTEERLADERKLAEQNAHVLGEEREKITTLTRNVAEVEGRLAAARDDAESLSRTIAGLEADARRQAELAAERERELAALIAQREADLATAHEELGSAREKMNTTRREMDGSTRSFTATVEQLKADKAALETALGQLRAERDRLQKEVAGLKHDAENAWASERVENALLRERINDVAAEVVRLSASLEGTGTIDRILGEATPRQNGPTRPIVNSPVEGAAIEQVTMQPAGAERPMSLAERIRALQARSRP
jgi:predicted  nucleic acid-binding Zn-ribbon protein